MASAVSWQWSQLPEVLGVVLTTTTIHPPTELELPLVRLIEAMPETWVALPVPDAAGVPTVEVAPDVPAMDVQAKLRLPSAACCFLQPSQLPDSCETPWVTVSVQPPRVAVALALVPTEASRMLTALLVSPMMPAVPCAMLLASFAAGGLPVSLVLSPQAEVKRHRKMREVVFINCFYNVLAAANQNFSAPVTWELFRVDAGRDARRRRLGTRPDGVGGRRQDGQHHQHLSASGPTVRAAPWPASRREHSAGHFAPSASSPPEPAAGQWPQPH